MNSTATHGITKRTTVADVLDEKVEELQITGYTLLESEFAPPEIAALKARLAEIDALQQRESGSILTHDAFIVRCPLAYDEMFLSVATHAPLMELCRRVLGENFVLLQQNGIINRPDRGNYQSRWHRDLSYQHFVASRTLALNALLCLDDFTSETGGTFVLPATHLQEDFPSDSFVRRHEIPATAKAGAFLVLNALLFHRAGQNCSTRNRCGINHVIGLPLLAQQIDIPRAINTDHSQDPFLSRYLGYRWNPAPDVTAWRSRRREGSR